MGFQSAAGGLREGLGGGAGGSAIDEFDAAVAGAAGVSGVGGDGGVGTDAGGGEAGAVDAAAGDEFIDDGEGAAHGEVEVGGGIAGVAGVADDVEFHGGLSLEEGGDFQEGGFGFRFDDGLGGVEVDAVEGDVAFLAEGGLHLGGGDFAFLHGGGFDDVELEDDLAFFEADAFGDDAVFVFGEIEGDGGAGGGGGEASGVEALGVVAVLEDLAGLPHGEVGVADAEHAERAVAGAFEEGLGFEASKGGSVVAIDLEGCAALGEEIGDAGEFAFHLFALGVGGGGSDVDDAAEGEGVFVKGLDEIADDLGAFVAGEEGMVLGAGEVSGGGGGGEEESEAEGSAAEHLHRLAGVGGGVYSPRLD